MVKYEPPHDIMTATEVAELMRVSARMVQLLASDGRLPAFRVGKYWRFRRDRIEAYMAREEDRPAPEPEKHDHEPDSAKRFAERLRALTNRRRQ